MKLPIIIAGLLLIGAGNLFAQTVIPRDQREGADHAREAEAFFERLHSVPEGFNWRIVNRAVREARIGRMQKMADGVQDGELSVNGTWRELGSDDQCGRIVAVDYDPLTQRVWVAGDGGTIWAGDITGTRWSILNETQQITYPRLVHHIMMPDGTTRLLAVSNQPACYYLEQGAAVWQAAEGLNEWRRWGNVQRAVACQRGGRFEVYLVGVEWDYGPSWKGRGVVYRSIDSGSSYQRLRWFDGQQALWSDGNANVFVIHGDTLSSIAPDGSFSTITVSTAWQRGNRNIQLAGVDADELMLSMYDGKTTSFKMSYDGGTTWDSVGTVSFGPFSTSCLARTTDPSRSWIYGGVEAFRSDESGVEWKAINRWGAYYADPENMLHADIPYIRSFITKDGKGLTFICTDGGIYTSYDGGASVKNISLRGLNTSQYYGSYTSRDNVVVVGAGSQDQGFQRSRVDNPGKPRSFQQLISGDYARLVSGDNGHSLWCVYPGFTMILPDFENGGARIGRDFVHRRGLWLPPLAVDPRTPDKVYLGGGSGTESGAMIYRYSYVGSNLDVDSLSLGVSDSRDITAIAIAQNAPDVWYVVTGEGRIHVSTSGGVNWVVRVRPKDLDGHYFGGNALALHPSDASTLYLGGQGYNTPAVYVSTDGAISWTALEGLPPCLVLGLALSSDARFLAAATDAGAYMYDTQLKRWTDITALGAPDQTYWHVDYVPPLNSFRFSTYGRGLWEFVPNGFTDVDEGDRVTYALNVIGVATPNGGSLQVKTREEGHATITWYDIDGRQLAHELIDLRQPTTMQPRPHGVPPGSMAVVMDRAGRVGACIVP
jgi:hypothetical protein